METVFKTFEFGPEDERYELKPFRHHGKDGYVIEIIAGENKWTESIFHHNKFDAVDHIFKTLFMKPGAKALYKRGLNRYPYFDYQKLATQTSGFNGAYTLSLTSSNNGIDLTYDDFVDSELKKVLV
jgi:hypothetical protein